MFRHGVAGAYPRPANFRPTQLRSPEDTAAALETVRLLLRWAKTQPDLSLTNYTQLCARDEEDPRQWLTFDQVVDLARQVLGQHVQAPGRFTYLAAHGTSFSCADLLGLFVFAVQYCWQHGTWPDRLPVQRLLGPTEEPLNVGATITIPREDLLAGSLAAYAIMMAERRVPAKLRARFTDLGPAELLHALARLLVEASRAGKLPLDVEVPPVQPLPDVVNEPPLTERRFGSSHLPAGFDFSHLWDLLKWQSWSYRPAVPPK